MKVNLKNQAGLQKEAKIGFSWTTLFFGFFPALFRGDWKWALIMFLVASITFSLSWLIFPFIYNKIYIKDLLEKGYAPADDYSRESLNRKNIIAA